MKEKIQKLEDRITYIERANQKNNIIMFNYT